MANTGLNTARTGDKAAAAVERETALRPFWWTNTFASLDSDEAFYSLIHTWLNEVCLFEDAGGLVTLDEHRNPVFEPGWWQVNVQTRVSFAVGATGLQINTPGHVIYRVSPDIGAVSAISGWPSDIGVVITNPDFPAFGDVMDANTSISFCVKLEESTGIGMLISNQSTGITDPIAGNGWISMSGFKVASL